MATPLGPLVETAIHQLPLTHLVTVPGSGLQALYDAFRTRASCIFATREEEAVALCCGLTVAGARPLVVMQQAGVGNCLNAVFTLADAYGICFPIIVCDRGPRDDNPAQRISSDRTLRALRALGARIVDLPGPGTAELREAVSAQTRWIVCRADENQPC